MAAALTAENKRGVVYGQQYDLWAPARQYMLYHGQPRILTEIASARLADPYVNPAGSDVPLGPQEARINFPMPYDRGVWRLGDIVDYGLTAAYAGLTEVARNRTTWMENYYRVHRDWTSATRRPTPSSSPPNSGTRTRPGSCSSCCTPARSRFTAPARGSRRAGGAFRPARG